MNFLETLRDIYIRAIAKLTDKMLMEFIAKNCQGCCEQRRLQQFITSTKHDLCTMMSWENQVVVFLPNILSNLTLDEVVSAYITMYHRLQPYHSPKQLKDVPDPFNLKTYIYITLKEMHTNLIFQTSIAQAVYGGCHRSHRLLNIEEFGIQYRNAVQR